MLNYIILAWLVIILIVKPVKKHVYILTICQDQTTVFYVSVLLTLVLSVLYMQVAANYVAMVPSGQIFDRLAHC